MSLKFTFLFLILAALGLLVGSSTDLAIVRLVSVWVAIDFGLLAIAYGGVGHRLLFKRSDGTRPVGAWLIHGPYFLLNSFGLWLFRLVTREPPFVEVALNLFLGRRLTLHEAKGTGRPQWRAVLDLAAEFSEVAPLRSVESYRSSPVLDTMSPGELPALVAWLVVRVADGPVYVHCALGHGRSATVVVAYLVAIGQFSTVEDSEAFVRSKRSGVRLNPLQRVSIAASSRIDHLGDNLGQSISTP